jgi:hypothetical protein
VVWGANAAVRDPFLTGLVLTYVIAVQFRLLDAKHIPPPRERLGGIETSLEQVRHAPDFFWVMSVARGVGARG